MQKRPDDRFGSARELRGELRSLLGQDDAYADAAPDSSQDSAMRTGGLLAQIDARPRRTGLVIAGVVLAASVVAGGIFYPRPGAAPVPHERVQTATITAASLTAAPHAPAPTTQVVDTTQPGAPGADPTSIAPAPVTRPHGMPKVNARRPTGSKTKATDIPLGLDEIPQLPDPKVAAPAKPAAAKPAAPAKADPADAPLPVFPIPSSEAP